MKLKKITAILLSLVLIFSVFAFSASAQGQLTFDGYVNGEWYSYVPIKMLKGEMINFTIEDVCLDGNPVDESQITCEWFRYDDETLNYDDKIEGATSTAYSEAYYGCNYYLCNVIVGNNRGFIIFSLKENTIAATATTNTEYFYDEEDFRYIVKPGLVGSECTLTVNATSTIPDAEITYTWKKLPYYEYPDTISEFVTLDNTTNSLDVVLKAGGSQYLCTVSDGTNEEDVYFEILPDNTLEMTNNTVNGIVPVTYAGTYIYVVKPDQKITIDVTSASTFGDVTYTWFVRNDDFSFTKLDFNQSIIEVTKSGPTEFSPYAEQPFECYIEDGNQKIRYQLLLFCLDPETPITEINKIGEDTPDVDFATEKEELANNVFSGDELKYMTWGMSANIELSAELKQTVTESDNNEISSKLQDNQQIGMHLEMNLQKNIEGEAIPLTELEKSIELTVDVPENMLNTDASVEREYKVIRMHDGEAEVLDCEFDAESNSLIFETDKFSLYTVVYSDTEVTFASLIKKALLGINDLFDKENLGDYDTNKDGIFNICDLVTIG